MEEVKSPIVAVLSSQALDCLYDSQFYPMPAPPPAAAASWVATPITRRLSCPPRLRGWILFDNA